MNAPKQTPQQLTAQIIEQHWGKETLALAILDAIQAERDELNSIVDLLMQRDRNRAALSPGKAGA